MSRENTSDESAGTPENTSLEKATFGAGCFWGVEETFRTQAGVKKTTAGYMGGSTDNPTYEEVCTGRSGHAEVVQVEFNPAEIQYEDLLKTFWQNHNPTELNRQGPDVGTQYRSAIFFHSAEQLAIAMESKDSLEEMQKYPLPIVTEVTEAATFYPAEDYHQKYLFKRGATSCHVPNISKE
ncbi:MAG: peptide-methionine (S)-S-oxide reductase MsrA [Pirellulaceae bacterium]|nr:peptide-methionine (S)-S-oxide reductase MsrA [Pirellulaceae bacterium]